MAWSHLGFECLARVGGTAESQRVSHHALVDKALSYLAWKVRQLVEAAGGTLLAWHPAIRTALAASQNTGFPPDAVAKVSSRIQSSHQPSGPRPLLLQLCTYHLLFKHQIHALPRHQTRWWLCSLPTGQPAAECGADGRHRHFTTSAVARERAPQSICQQPARGAGPHQPALRCYDVGRLAVRAAVVGAGSKRLARSARPVFQDCVVSYRPPCGSWLVVEQAQLIDGAAD